MECINTTCGSASKSGSGVTCSPVAVNSGIIVANGVDAGKGVLDTGSRNQSKAEALHLHNGVGNQIAIARALPKDTLMKIDQYLVGRNAIPLTGPLVNHIKLGTVNIKFQDSQRLMAKAPHHTRNGKHGHIKQLILGGNRMRERVHRVRRGGMTVRGGGMRRGGVGV